MEAKQAQEIAESVGCFFRFDELMQMYTVYVGQSWAHIKPDAFNKLNEAQYKYFLVGFMAQEAEDIMRYGVVRH